MLMAAITLQAANPISVEAPIAIKTLPAFKAGETLSCNLYFNWKFVRLKAGNASLIIRDTLFDGKKAMFMSLLSSTNKRADAFF